MILNVHFLSVFVTGLPWWLTGKESTWQSLGWEDPLEKKTATHFSILAWGIP